MYNSNSYDVAAVMLVNSNEAKTGKAIPAQWHHVTKAVWSWKAVSKQNNSHKSIDHKGFDGTTSGSGPQPAHTQLTLNYLTGINSSSSQVVVSSVWAPAKDTECKKTSYSWNIRHGVPSVYRLRYWLILVPVLKAELGGITSHMFQNNSVCFSGYVRQRRTARLEGQGRRSREKCTAM